MFEVFGSLYHANTLERHIAASHDSIHHSDDEEPCQRVDTEPREEDDGGSEGGEEEDIVSTDAVGESYEQRNTSQECVQRSRPKRLTTGTDPTNCTGRITGNQHIRSLPHPSLLDRKRSAKVQEEEVPKREAEGGERCEEVDGMRGECTPVEGVFLRR